MSPVQQLWAAWAVGVAAAMVTALVLYVTEIRGQRPAPVLAPSRAGGLPGSGSAQHITRK